MQNKNLSKIVMFGIPALVILIIALIGGLSFMPKPAANNTAPTSTQAQSQDIAVSVADKDGNKTNYTAAYEAGKSAFDTLKKLQDQNKNFTFVYSESSYGAFVTGINGFSPDAKTAFWEFMVNGQSSMLGISDYKVQPGDKLEFKITKIVPLQ